MNNDPKVSIIIPVYNGENFVKEAIDSALAQSYKNIEVIVVSDGSSDNTAKIAKAYGDKIRFFEKENGGVSTALNLGIKMMTGDYFSWLSHDDLYYKNKIESNIKFINKINDEKAIIMSDYEEVSESGLHLKYQRHNSKEIESFPLFAVIKTYINGLTLLIPKSAFDEVGLFNTEMRCVQDYDMWWRFYQAGYHFVHQSEVLTKTRVHKMQVTLSQTNKVAKEGNDFWLSVLKKISPDAKISLSGSNFSFYKEIHLVFKNSSYNQVNKYLEVKIKTSSEIGFKKIKLIRIIWLFTRDIKYKGLRSGLGAFYRGDYFNKR